MRKLKTATEGNVVSTHSLSFYGAVVYLTELKYFGLIAKIRFLVKKQRGL